MVIAACCDVKTHPSNRNSIWQVTCTLRNGITINNPVKNDWKRSQGSFETRY